MRQLNLKHSEIKVTDILIGEVIYVGELLKLELIKAVIVDGRIQLVGVIKGYDDQIIREFDKTVPLDGSSLCAVDGYPEVKTLTEGTVSLLSSSPTPRPRAVYIRGETRTNAPSATPVPGVRQIAVPTSA